MSSLRFAMLTETGPGGILKQQVTFPESPQADRQAPEMKFEFAVKDATCDERPKSENSGVLHRAMQYVFAKEK